MGVEALIALITAGAQAIFDYVVDQSLHNGIHAGEDTDIVFGSFVAGTGTYRYTDQNGTVTTENADFSIFSSAYDNLFIVKSSHVNWYLAQIGSSGTPQISNYWSSGVIFAGNGRYAGVCNVDGTVTVSSAAGIDTLYFMNYNTNFANYGYQSGTGDASNGSAYPLDSVSGAITNNSDAKNVFSDAIYVPADSSQAYSYNDMRQMIYNYVTVNYPDSNITIDDIPSWDELASETETESETESETETNSGSCCGCNCTTIYVNADGSLTLQNDVSGDINLSVNNDAELSLNVSAAAGAFGAGAIVIDPDANITLGAGAFGAGAFGAGAIVSPNIDVSGNLDIGDISGSIDLNASDISFDLSAGDINIDQSGATNNNTYNTTNNTNNYYGTTEPFEIDYNEILSEDELESILTDETYDVSEIESITETVIIDIEDMVIEGDTEYREIIDFVPDALGVSMDLLSSMNIASPLTSAAIISCLWKIIKGR